MKERYYSLDVFRGATIALMILVNNPGSWSYIYPPLEHAPWHGLTPTDLVFPFFLFAVGNAMAFVMPSLKEKSDTHFWKKVIKRTLLIFFIGLFLNWFPFVHYDENNKLIFQSFNQVRIFGVLQRIALCYFFASIIIYYLKIRGSFIVSGFILLAYWFACIAANPADPFSLSGWFGTAIDKMIIGEAHMYHGEGIAFDPEGLMSFYTGVVQVIFGYLVGHFIISKGKTAAMLNGLFVTASVLIFTGYCWDMVFPINKKIWTSSYTVFTTGLAMVILALMIYLIEFKQKKGIWSRFCDVFGKNPLFIFVLSGLLPRLLDLIQIPGWKSPEGIQYYTSPLGWFYEYICKPIFPSDPRIGSLVYALCFITLMWFVAWFLDKKRIYFKV